MIESKTGDLLAEPVEALVNTVNCVGIMGRGVALQFKGAFPENFRAYARACEAQEVRPGQMFVHETGLLTYPRYIINFPTKRHWKGKSRLEDIDAGLVALVEQLRQRQIRSIAIPPLGAGLELLATVHWVMAHEGISDPEKIVTRIHAWNTRKQQFTPRQIGIAVKVLTQKDWLPKVQAEA